MSIVLQGSTSGSITLQEPAIAGNTVLSLPATSGTLITTGSTGQVIPKAALPTGSVLQVVQGTLTGTFSTTSSTYVDTGVSATITPTSNTSKILVFVSTMAGVSTVNDSFYSTIFRNSTNIYYGSDAGKAMMGRQYQTNSGASDGWQLNLSYLDSPATTSATTYSLRIRTDGNGATLYVGRIVAANEAGGGVIQLMEIAA